MKKIYRNVAKKMQKDTFCPRATAMKTQNEFKFIP
jgi:hypothetical protein